MRIYTDVKSMQAGIATVVKSLSSKPTMKILEGIYMEAREDKLLLRCSDLSLQIDCELPATIEEEGATVLPGRLFADIVRKIDGETIDMRLSGRTMTIKGGRARSSLQCLDPSEYPDMVIKGEVCTVNLPQIVCKDMIRQTVFAVATEDSKPILTGLLCELNENEFNMVALDGYRLAMRSYVLDRPYENKEFVVPGKSITEIGRSLLDNDIPVTLQFSRTHLLLDMGHTRIISRLLEGNFIKYRKLLPAEHVTRVRVNREELFASIERAMLLAKEGGNNLVRFDIQEGNLQITANSPMGRMEEDMEINLNGNPIEIAFNARYFHDVLRALDEVDVFLDMNNSVSPCVMRPVQGGAFYYLILPVRIFS